MSTKGTKALWVWGDVNCGTERLLHVYEETLDRTVRVQCEWQQGQGRQWRRTPAVWIPRRLGRVIGRLPWQAQPKPLRKDTDHG